MIVISYQVCCARCVSSTSIPGTRVPSGFLFFFFYTRGYILIVRELYEIYEDTVWIHSSRESKGCRRRQQNTWWDSRGGGKVREKDNCVRYLEWREEAVCVCFLYVVTPSACSHSIQAEARYDTVIYLGGNMERGREGDDKLFAVYEERVKNSCHTAMEDSPVSQAGLFPVSLLIPYTCNVGVVVACYSS